MTIQTPTDNIDTSQGVAGIGGQLPAGFPDEATLARMANAMFTAIPGVLEKAGIADAPAVPQAPLFLQNLAQSLAASQGLPVTETRLNTIDLDRVDNSAEFPVRSPSLSPSLATSSPPQIPSVTHGVENRIAPHSFALPGQVSLQQILAELAGEDHRPPFVPATAATVATAKTTNASPAFYFVDIPSGFALPARQRLDGQVPSAAAAARAPFDVHAIRKDFPILSERVNGRPLIWFDNAATTQKPQAVIDRLAYFYQHENSNIHRAAHTLAARATDAYEHARNTVARFLGAASADEIIFVRGATEGINLVAQSWGRQNIQAGDEIIVSILEHHANIVPWQQLASEKGAVLRVIPVDSTGQILLEEYQRLLNDRTKLVAVTQVSNALGTVTPVKEIIDLAHQVGAHVLVDGAQAISHMRVNVQALDADFYVFSGHKVFGPTGIGAVYGKKAILEATQPWQGGGNMIADVTFERTLYHGAPMRFEAGTGNIADAAGLATALEYVERIGIENIARYEHDLLAYATQQILTVPGVQLVGTASNKASILSFVLAGYKPEEVGAALNQEGIAVRSGHHCAQPILRRFGHEATVRPSLAFYNTCEEVDRFISVIQRLARAR